jgi:hypothetical protein
MPILLMLPFLICNFVQKWNLPYGSVAPGGRILVSDTDHDGNIELIFRRWIPGSVGLYIAEYVPPDSWDIFESQTVDSILVWDAGDFDGDGLSDLVVYGDASSGGGPPIPIIAIYESPDSFSYPTQEVWRDTVGFALVTPICCYDIDRDSLPEIVKIIGDTTDFDIYESVGDNTYLRIFRDTIPASHSPMSTVAFGDFDLDNQNEFVFGYSGGEYSIWECMGNNSYQEVLLQQLSTLNIKDCFSVPDADGDGKLEFVVKGFVIPTAEIHAFIFEATGNNTYEIIKTFTLPGGDYYGGYSDVGDVDGDSVPEIALEGCQSIYIIKAIANDSFYVWETLPGNNSGSSVRVYDVDGNGLSEVIISGNDQTRIYEYEVGIKEATNTAVQGLNLNIHPNPFTRLLNIEFQNLGEKEVTIKVYDITGRLVRTLHKKTTNRDCTLAWYGDDQQGKSVAPGVYFVRFDNLDTGDIICRKVLMVK